MVPLHPDPLLLLHHFLGLYSLVGNSVSDYSFEECLSDYRLSMLDMVVFWVVTGGYCDYNGERAAVYLHKSLERFDAAISNLACAELLSN